jgi:hypothetical protein
MFVRDRLEGAGESSGVAGALSGALGEALLAPIWIPLDVIAQRIQVSPLPSKGDKVGFTQWRGLSIARDIYRSEGVRGYYKGTAAFLLMYVPGAAVQWGSYEVCKRFFHRLNDSWFPAIGSPGARLLSEQMTSAVAAATVTSCVMNPMDIIKTRIQSGRTMPQYDASTLPPAVQQRPALSRSVIVNEFFHLIKKEGVRALGKGLLPRLATTIPVMTVESVIYELALAVSLKKRLPVESSLDGNPVDLE